MFFLNNVKFYYQVTKKAIAFKICHFLNYKSLPRKVFCCTLKVSKQCRVLKKLLNAILFNNTSIKILHLIECSQNSLINI